MGRIASGCENREQPFEIAIGFDSNDLSWFSQYVTRDEGMQRGIRGGSKKMRGIRFFWFTVSKKPVTPPNTLTKGKMKIPLLLFLCRFLIRRSLPKKDGPRAAGCKSRRTPAGGLSFVRVRVV